MSTNSKQNTLIQEQNKKNLIKSETFFQYLKIFLEKDTHNIFKIKTNKILNERIVLLDDKIQKLLNLKIRSDQTIKLLNEKRKTLVANNKKLRESLIQKLKLGAEK